MPTDPKQLAALRKLIGQEDAGAVRQGIELLRTLDDRDVWSLMADGLEVDSTGVISIGKDSEIARRARPTRRGELALWALRGAGRLADVEVLDLRELGELHDLDAVAGLTYLRELRHWQTAPLANIDGLAGLGALEVLHVGHLARGATLDALAPLVNLREVVLAGVEGVTTLDPLAACVQLRSLDVRWGDSLRDLRALTACTALRSLTLGDVPDLATLAGHTGLVTLTLSPAPTNMRGIATLTGVRTLRLTGAVSPTNLGEIAKMPGLETLILEDAGPTDLAMLAGAPALTALEVAGATFTSLVLSGMAKLRQFIVSDSAVERVERLTDLPALRSLTFKRCKALAGLGGLSGVPQLESLDLSDCTSVHDLDVLADLAAVTHLDLRGCTGLHWSIELRLYAGARAGSAPARLRARAPTVATIGKNPARKSSETKLIHRLLRSAQRDEFEEGLTLALALGDPAIWLPYEAGGSRLWRVHPAFRHRIIEATLPEAPTSLQFDDLGPTAEYLNIDFPTVEDIEALRACTDLRSLTLRCSARDLTPLAALARLETLTLRCAAEDLTPLAACASLRELTLSCRSRNLDGLAGCTELRKLTLLGWSDLEQVNALAQLPNLEELRYERCSCIENGAKGRMQGEELAAAMQWLRDSQAK